MLQASTFFEMDYFWILTSTTSHPNSSPHVKYFSVLFSSHSVELYIIRSSLMRYYLKDYFHSSGWFWPTFVLVLLHPTMVSLYFLCRSYIQVYHKQINDDIIILDWNLNRRHFLRHHVNNSHPPAIISFLHFLIFVYLVGIFALNFCPHWCFH